MYLYAFQLGREPVLSAAEIHAMIPLAKATASLTGKEWLMVKSDDALDPYGLMKLLGGTIKIAEALNQKKSGADALRSCIIDHIQKTQPEGKIHFALNDRRLALIIKKEMKLLGRNVRYINIQNSATIIHNKLVERSADFTVIDGIIFVTRAIQPIEEYAEREFGRPGADARSGMLPAKLARIMINLAHIPKTESVLLDPFCGSGTILTEAMLMGYTSLIGSDQSGKAVADTKKNIAWAKESFHLASVSARVYQHDARHLHTSLPPISVDAIVTEPYLGVPLTGRESEQFLRHQARTLEGLYGEALSACAKLLRRGSPLVMIVPTFLFKTKEIAPDISSAAKKAGLAPSPLIGEEYSLRYQRPGQYLVRTIWRLVKVS